MNYEDENNDIRPLAPSNLEGELKIENFNENGNFNFNNYELCTMHYALLKTMHYALISHSLILL